MILADRAAEHAALFGIFNSAGDAGMAEADCLRGEPPLLGVGASENPLALLNWLARRLDRVVDRSERQVGV